MKNETILAKLTEIINKINNNSIDVWEDNLADTKPVVILADFSKNAEDEESNLYEPELDFKYNGWLEELEALEKELKGEQEEPVKERITWARKCDVTGEGMNEGWIIGDYYYKYQKDADAHARTIPNEEKPKKGNYKNFKELYDSMDEDDDFCYWTEWDEDDHMFEEINGVLTEIQ